MKRIIILFLFISMKVSAQDINLLEQSGITLTYQLIKLSETEKKDTYLLVVKANNKNNYDAFYQGPKNGVNPFFGEVTVRNANAMIYLTGTESKLSTVDGKLLYLKSLSTMSFEKEFKIDKEQKPIITAKFFGDLDNVSELR